MMHSGSDKFRKRPVMEPVKIYPNTNIHKELTADQAEAVLSWFRANGVDPDGLPMTQAITIDTHIDFWWTGGRNQPDPTWPMLEGRYASGEYPETHHQVEVTEPLPDELATALREIASRRDAEQDAIRSRLAASGILGTTSDVDR